MNEVSTATPVESRNQAYLDLLADEQGLNDQYKLILKFIISLKVPGAIFGEIEAGTGIPINVVTARVRELVVDYGLLYTDKTRRINPVSKKPNTVWYVNFLKFHELGLFCTKFKRKDK